jgi:hypothetical protein
MMHGGDKNDLPKSGEQEQMAGYPMLVGDIDIKSE